MKYLRYKIMSIILSNRNDKDDLYIKEIKKDNGELLNFKTMRDVCYLYSSKTQDTFFQDSFYSFLFLRFTNRPDIKSYIWSKLLEKQNQNKFNNYLKELHNL